MNKGSKLLALLVGILVMQLLGQILEHRRHVESLRHGHEERMALLKALPGLIADAKTEITRRKRETADWLTREQLKPLR